LCPVVLSISHAEHRHVHALRIEELGKLFQVARLPRFFADPEEVGIHHEDGPAIEQFQALREPAAGIHQRVPLVEIRI
jgi:hypothetical protein